MNNTDKLNQLITAARQHPEKLQPHTLHQVNQHLQRTGQPPITLPAPKMVFGRSLTLAERAAINNGQPLPPPPRPTMTTAQYQQQQLERARELEAKRNSEKKPGIRASFLGL